MHRFSLVLLTVVFSLFLLIPKSVHAIAIALDASQLCSAFTHVEFDPETDKVVAASQIITVATTVLHPDGKGSLAIRHVYGDAIQQAKTGVFTYPPGYPLGTPDRKTGLTDQVQVTNNQDVSGRTVKGEVLYKNGSWQFWQKDKCTQESRLNVIEVTCNFPC